MSQEGPGDGDVGAPVPSAPTEALPEDHLGLGSVVGERYQIRSRLGRGGMGEVWLAYDLKLRVDVALKALRPELMADGERLDLLRREVRAAREVTSPNVCRIFDLIELDGRELVSMEYVDGTTLLDVLVERAPLEPTEAQDIASQFLAGLEAIHRAGLVHRDVKPENIMITRTGRVVVMDFGLARSAAEGAGSVSGTPAYMAPEQARGEAADARADLFSAGVVLAEMVSPEGLRDFESRQSVWEGIRKEPIELPESPWKPVVRKAVASDPGNRYGSAHELTRALEEVAFRVHDEEGLEPYPGLAAFSEEDAAYFFGREAEVEAVWKKLQSTHLLAIVGASGTGKSSFIGAGLMPTRPEGWATARCTPGKDALTALRAAAVAEIEDPDAIRRLAAGGDDAIVEVFAAWRKGHDQALLIIDQFEELFTQNSEEVQARTSSLIRRLVLDADVHVVLGMRDDFLLRCHDQDALAPVFSELTPLRPPIGGALRRAVVQPALKCGYRFEDEELADEILAEVEGERGALPLLAFALGQLWERRDRENGLLTREAYRGIGGVGGALAQHAEETVARIGEEVLPILRELFRNLVTAQGTRASHDIDELLTVFSEDRREDARRVLDELINARLLTSYEIQTEEGPGRQQVEIVHESLLERWPRLVRWRTQDADSARLRDELRQAARLWGEHDRSDDRLWTGVAYREFASWRERYAGGLTEVEEAFARAMTSLATRRKRRRRFVTAAALSIATVVTIVFGVLWRRSVLNERRAEAATLVALGELRIEPNPTAALAWATASLELVDNMEARMLALRALQRGPPMTVLPTDPTGGYGTARLAFSPSGRWLVTSAERATLWFHDGREGIRLEDHDLTGNWLGVAFTDEDHFITDQEGTCRWWSTTNPQQPLRVEEGFGFLKAVRGEGFFTYSKAEDKEWVHRWSLDGKTHTVVGGMNPWWWLGDDIDTAGLRLVYPRANEVFLRPFADWSNPPTEIGKHDSPVSSTVFRPDGKHVAAADGGGEIRVWSIDRETSWLIRTISDSPAKGGSVRYDSSGRRLAVHGGSEDGLPITALWDLEAPQGCMGQQLRRDDPGDANQGSMAFHPNGRWLAAANYGSVGFWPLSRQHPWVLEHRGRVFDVAFSPDGDWLVSAGGAGPAEVIAWPLKGQNEGKPRVLLEQPGNALYGCSLAVHPSGAHVAVSNQSGEVIVVPIESGPPTTLANPDGTRGFRDLLAFSADGRYLAAVPSPPTGHDVGEMDVRIWDVETGTGRGIGKVRGQSSFLGFLDDHRLLWSGSAIQGEGGLESVFDLERGTVEIISEDGSEAYGVVSSKARFVISLRPDFDLVTSEVLWRDLESGESRLISTHGSSPWQVRLDPTDRWMATGSVTDGLVRVGPVSGGEPHLLFGHSGFVTGVEFSPDGRWIASCGWDQTIRLWPMPDLSKPPLHTLPHDELIAKLHSLTNLRAVRDEESSTGWKIEIGPFPGWAEVPEW